MNNKVKGLAVVIAGLGVLAAGGLLSPDGKSSAGNGWKAEPDSGAPKYTGPDPLQEDVLQDFNSVAASAGLGPGIAGGGVVNAAGCVAAQNHIGTTSDAQLTVIVDRLADHGWRITQRRTAAPVAVALSKGTWSLVVTPDPPGGTQYLSLTAIRNTPACEGRLAAP
ncbi:hypothetical protein [Streptomyces sp. NPDC057939]|uniref:hypothetical protein n=1 Tax=Streptomyces sp. NPDC057939 TaxID=3346284 RepID=UPI0036DFE9D9